MNKEYSRQFKIIVVGDSSVGKTSFINQYCTGNFDPDIEPTVCLGYQSTILTLPSGESIKLCIWDPAGQEKFHSLTRQFFRNINGVMLLYDVSKKETLDHLESYWVPLLKENAPDSFVTMIVGNKCDLKSEATEFVEKGAGQKFAQICCAVFVEASAKTALNVESAFHELVQQIASMDIPRENAEDKSVSIDDENDECMGEGIGRKSSCCFF